MHEDSDMRFGVGSIIRSKRWSKGFLVFAPGGQGRLNQKPGSDGG